MAVARKKISKSGFILIALLIVAVIAFPILHITGILDLTFLADGFLGVYMWGSMSFWNAFIITVVTFALGMFTFYMLKGYIIGEKQVLIPGTAYNPVGQTITPQQQSEETVVS